MNKILKTISAAWIASVICETNFLYLGNDMGMGRLLMTIITYFAIMILFDVLKIKGE